MNFRSTRSQETVTPSYALLHGLARMAGSMSRKHSRNRYYPIQT